MGYGDRVASSTKPECWGTDAFDPTDVECESCRLQHSCRQNQDVYRPVSVRRPSTSYTPRRARRESSDDRDIESSWDSGVVGDHERPIDRFFKDAASGALRGMFYEMYSFWKRFRIR